VRIISKYVLREHLGPLVFAMSALTSLLLLNYIAKQLPQLVGKGLPWDVIAEFVVLSLPFTIAMTLPMAVLVATLHAFSRLAADSEITAFKASGMALPRLMAPVVVAGLALSLLMVWFNDQVMPAANYALQTLSNDIARKKPTFALRPQIINQVSPSLYLRAVHLTSGTSEMRDVTIYDFTDPNHRRTIRADSGHVEMSSDGRDLIMTLAHGFTTEMNRPEPLRLQRVFFNTSRVRVRGIGNQLERNASGGERSDRERTVCELRAQLRNAITTRDSIYGTLRKLDPAAARAIGNAGVFAGSAEPYCWVTRALTRAVTPREAHAAEVAQAATAQAATAQAAVPATPQASGPPAQAQPTAQPPAPGPIPAQGGGQPDAAGRPAAALVPPSSGYGADGQSPAVVVETMKLQIASMQATINGDLVEIEKKFAIATACVIFALLGAPIAFRFPRGGVGLTIGVSLTVFGVYYVGLLLGEELARRSYLPPFVGMWATNGLLLVIGLALTARLGHEGTTTRGSELSDAMARFLDRFRRRRAAAGA
jgi:lipopolysaccharide export system permease protein